MSGQKEEAGTGNEKGGALPLHVQMLDIVFDQIDRSAPLVATALKDLQAMYLSGMRVVLKAGEALEKGSPVKIAAAHRLAQAFEKVAPAILQAQLEATEAVVASTRSGIRVLRDTIAGNG